MQKYPKKLDIEYTVDIYKYMSWETIPSEYENKKTRAHKVKNKQQILPRVLMFGLQSNSKRKQPPDLQCYTNLYLN